MADDNGAAETEQRFNDWWEACQQYAKDVEQGIAEAEDPAQYLKELGEWNDAVESERRRLDHI